MRKLAIISTHPIQYNAPVFKLLSERNKIQIKVFYTWENSKEGIFDLKFNQNIKWDIPLLDGYEYEFAKNTSKKQGSHSFWGIKNPELIVNIENWGADALLVFGWKFQSHLKAIRYFKNKIPVFFRGDSTLLDEKPGIKTFIRRFILKFVFKKIDYAMYVGINNKNYYLMHGIPENHLIFAPHAIDNERFTDKDGIYAKEATQWRQNLGFSAEDIVFLYAGKFEPIKNLDLIIKAAKKLQNLKFKFILAGDGELKAHLKNLASNNNNIVFLPFQNQSAMPVVYRLCDVFVLPSRSETWGLAVNEAMACGKAVLVSDKTGCAPDLIQENKNGFVFHSGDLSDLITKVTRFNSENCINFGYYSKNKIENFNFSNISDAIERIVSQSF